MVSRTKYVLSFLFLLLHFSLGFGWASVSAQGTADRPIAELVGGSIRTRLMVAGSGELWSAAAGPVRSNTAGNPAMLGLLEKRSIRFDWVPGISSNVQSLIDVDGAVRDGLDGLMGDYGTAGSRVQYPSLIPVLGFESNAADLEACVPFRLFGLRAGIEAGYGVPVSAAFEFTGTGMEAAIDSEQDIQGERKRIRMRIRSNLSGLVHARAERIRFGAGVDLGRGAALGVSFSRVRFTADGCGRAGIDAVVEISGTEYVYNDPNDPRIDFASGEQNDLNQRFDARYAGSGWGVRIGASKRLFGSFRIGAVVDLPPRIRFAGTDSIVNNRIPFIEIGGGNTSGEIDEMIDPTKIDLSKLTLTERILKKNQWQPLVALPRAFGAGLAWDGGIRHAAAGFTVYRGAFSVSSGADVQGIRLKYGVSAELDLRYLFFGGAADWAETVPTGEKSGSPVVIPRAGFGFRIPVNRSFQLETRLSAEPVPALRVSGRFVF